MSVEIPVHDKGGNVVGIALISPQDEDMVSKYRWHLSQGYAFCRDSGTALSMTHLILGKPDRGLMIDHINRNRLDNRRENLRIVTRSQNNQNRETQSDHYVGIYFSKQGQKWVSKCGIYNLGSYTNALDAAIAYDKCAYVLLGEHSKTNGLISYDECKDLKLENLTSTRRRLLPTNIYHDHGCCKFVVIVKKNYKNYYSPYYETLTEAEEWLHKFKIEWEEKAKIVSELQTITRNKDGHAIISYRNIDILVDDDLWHELYKYSWRLREQSRNSPFVKY
jgi:hypothetical protein